MSIIDQIGDIEDQLQQIRKDGDSEIIRIKSETDIKKQQLQNALSTELNTQKEQLNQEMLQRVEEYKKNLSNNEINIKELLEQRYRLNKSKILQQICKDFWSV